MLFLEFAHVDHSEVLFPTIEHIGNGQSSFGLTYTRSAREHEDADRFAWICQTRTIGLNGLRNGGQSMRLADHALLKSVLQSQDGFDLIGDHATHGDAGPGFNNFGDSLAIHYRMHQGLFAL